MYQPGDRLYLFGFSHGAYTIRALAGMIQYCGIVDINGVSNGVLENRVNACWKEFTAVAFKRKWDVDRRGNVVPTETPASGLTRRKSLGAIIHSEFVPDGQPSIEFVGVWDTVAAVGLPFEELRDILNFIYPVKFAELFPGSRIKRACHALSIDDERQSFHPELWNEQRASRPDQIKQVWFTGVHSNVGGGYPKQGMSLVALDWMMAEAEQCGLRFIPGDRESIRTHQDIHDKLYDPRAGLAVYYRWGPRNIVTLCRNHNINMPKIHVSVFKRIANGTGGYAPGNIPFACEVVTTQHPTPEGSSPWPTQTAIQAIQQEIAQSSLPANSSLLDTMPHTIGSGKLSYYAFIGSTILALVWLWNPPSFLENAAGPGWAKGLVVGLFLVVGSIIMAWSHMVDNKLDVMYSSFWDLRRKKLRELLDKQDRKDIRVGPVLPERDLRKVG